MAVVYTDYYLSNLFLRSNFTYIKTPDVYLNIYDMIFNYEQITKFLFIQPVWRMHNKILIGQLATKKKRQ